MKVLISLVCLIIGAFAHETPADYTGYKVLTITPKRVEDVQFLHDLRKDYSVDLWSEPRVAGGPVMTHLPPRLSQSVEDALKHRGIHYNVAFRDLQKVIDSEKIAHSQSNTSHASSYNFGIYNRYAQVEDLLKYLGTNYPQVAKLQTIGNSYENRPIYALKIASGASKPVIMLECGIHAREWSSVAACAYFVNKLITEYSTNSDVKNLLDKYEIDAIVEANPDGYEYTWTQDRMWRKTRSRSAIDWLGVCRGVDANRNFDIEHCGIGTSRKPCEDIFCGDTPFSENESRAIRDLLISVESRIKGYFSLHAFSQLWMTPYGITKRLPDNYNDLVRVGTAGANALATRYGTRYRVGAIANIIYEATGSSVDYAYVKHAVKMAFALELRDQGRYGFFLPQQQILPMCEETYDGLVAAIKAI